MIVELFGPPGAGKTTFAHALAKRLQERGLRAELKLSYRPVEHLQPPAPRMTPAAQYRYLAMRLRRPLVEMLVIARHPLVNARDVRTAAHLVRSLPPASVFASFKMAQYALRLSHSWHEKAGAAHVVLFDQAFVQAVCSLALLAGGVDDTLIGSALAWAPKSDLLVRLIAPLDLLKARLHDRQNVQSALEQLFEPNLSRSLASARMVDRLSDVLQQQGRSVLSASSVDQSSLEESVCRIEREVTSRLQSCTQNNALRPAVRAVAPFRAGDGYE
ncbi:hypothetical protein [Bradyrhizobium sp. CCBAU 53338]|uniref:hypothetical protein n=1 Tax=Bradyrhizobium sp. CCBAU 53338 TaxID=1325111 RepID=UPI00188CAD44|nr:hypothetical protein [Bradyrhizobium sp. CCBAU 53338]QOZ54557.1 hypothetical protein XH90_26675 [Bradyrhizobium sp. CCBAU 53338]